MKFTTLQKKDYKKAIQYAIMGMHFDTYLTNERVCKLYGRYFLYNEMQQATHIIAAYENEKLMGLLLARMNGEKVQRHSLWQRMYIGFMSFIMNQLCKDSAGIYESVNKEMLREYNKNHKPDGEVVFLAVDPERQGKGIGSLLLSELEKKEAGKQIYLYTDSFCSYQFYEHRGFTRVGEKKIKMDFDESKTEMTCMLYAKKLEDKNGSRL